MSIDAVLNENSLLAQSEYFSIHRAATILGCEAQDLLHLGVIGKAEIMGAVVVEGVFEWPIGYRALACLGIDDQFTFRFDATSRVIFVRDDLARIESLGWTIPVSFYAPEFARSLMEDHENFGSMNENLFHSIWNAEVILELNSDVERTTINHLFVATSEVIRLKEGSVQDGIVIERQKNEGKQKGEAKKPHGNSEVAARKREEVLAAAIHCMKLNADECNKSGVAWAAMIDEKAALFWPDEGSPPLSRSKIERMLGKAVSDGKPYLNL